MNSGLDRACRRFARFVTRVVVAQPVLWRIFRGPLRAQFDRLAPVWEGRRSSESFAPVEAALARLEVVPGRILDLGTGTGLAARLLAERFPSAEVVGVDVSPAMVAEARRMLSPTLTLRVDFQVADGAKLPFADASFDLVVLLNMIPFFDELARVTVDGGAVIVASSRGAETPIYVPGEVLRRRLGRVGFTRLEELVAGPGTAVVARRS